eukprot:SAG31_NODE_1610_length_7751_cov_2.938447_10_plen_641_part_00
MLLLLLLLLLPPPTTEAAAPHMSPEASPCAAALIAACNRTKGTGAPCNACLADHAKELAPCRAPRSKCARSNCLAKFCASAPPAPPPAGKMCYDGSGVNGVCGRDFQRCLPSEPAGAPQYHIRDLTCGTSDVNAPFRDPRTGVWHVFYQDLLLTNKSAHRAKVWGHAVSQRGVHWTRLPVALWPDTPYDNTNIFSGSATIVGQSIYLVYPGLWKAGPGQPSPGAAGRDLAVAIPASAADPLLTNWTKLGTIVRNTLAGPLGPSGSDPSSAWLERGEWRLTTAGAMITASMDFKTWYQIGIQPNFTHSADPSFFPLPRPTSGSGTSPAGSRRPFTHVYKASVAAPGEPFRDYYQLGVLTPGGPRANSTWIGGELRVIDGGGNYQTSKDFYDPETGRRILWGNVGAPPNGALSLPREVTFHNSLQQLVFSPLREQMELRDEPLGRLQGLTVDGSGIPHPIYDAQRRNVDPQRPAGLQAEVVVTFAVPDHQSCFGVIVLGGASTNATSGLLFFVNYTAEAVRRSHASSNVNTEVPYEVEVGAIPVCVKTGCPKLPAQRHPPLKFPRVSKLQMLPRDKNVTMSIYVDHTVAECFLQGGRTTLSVVATAMQGVPTGTEASMSIVANGGAVRVEEAEAWAVGSIWT